MTLISKVKTLIDYAKFGMYQCNHYLNKTEKGELFFPRAIKVYNFNYRNGYHSGATTIKGYLEKVGGQGWLGDIYGATVKVIDLPNCYDISSGNWGGDRGSGKNTTLEICKLPNVVSIGFYKFENFTALKYLEFGAITSCDANAFRGLTALTDFVIGKNTARSLYLQNCPNLTQECLHNIIDNLADITGSATEVLQIGSDNIAKLSDEYLNKILNKKNWRLL